MGGERDGNQVQERHGSSLSSIKVSLYSARLKCTSKRGSTSQQEGWGSGKFSFGDYKGKQELGGIRVHLEVRTSSADLGLEQSVVVLRTVRQCPAFDPLFFWGERPNSEIRTIVLS